MIIYIYVYVVLVLCIIIYIIYVQVRVRALDATKLERRRKVHTPLQTPPHLPPMCDFGVSDPP